MYLITTYKVIKYNYPLMVFGATDMARQFHPIAYMVTSHETDQDFSHFLDSIADIAERFGIVFDPKYITVDACKVFWQFWNNFSFNKY